MTSVTLKGNPVAISGNFPAIGTAAPDFVLTRTDLSEGSLEDYRGKQIVLNIFPSVDTPTCALSVKRFNEEAGKRQDTVVLCVSRDLPFAHKRFCSAQEIEHVIPFSEFRRSSFGESYGVKIADGPLQGLFARAVIVIDKEGSVTYTELVEEIANEPDYEAALAACS